MRESDRDKVYVKRRWKRRRHASESAGATERTIVRGGGASRTLGWIRERERERAKNRNICKTARKRRAERAPSDRPGGPAAAAEEERMRGGRGEVETSVHPR